MKEITIGQKRYPVAFDMQAIINFEEITGRSFFASDFATLTDKVAVIVSAALSADKKTSLTVDDVLGGKDWEACKIIFAAFNIVSEEMTAFFPVPEIEKQANPAPESKEEDDPKN
jgi:hypothetical protein